MLTSVRNYIEYVKTSTLARLIAVYAVLALLFLLVPPLRNLLVSLPWLGPVLVLVGALTAMYLAERGKTELDAVTTDRDRISGSLTEAQGERRRLAEELAGFRPIVDETSADTTSANAIMSLFPNNTGFVQWLRITPTLTSWYASDISALSEFVRSHQDTEFENTAVHTAFLNFRNAAVALNDWFRAEGVETDDVLTARDGDRHFTLREASAREAGWGGFSAARAESEQLADIFRNEFLAFERVGLEQGTLDPRRPQPHPATGA
ncbi:hypothetical protein LWF01_09175 [Saxibacter everestensis]|uniref:Uncharacterized protein n=1 Tax=Saxibacter everestensis TaxID=2909229 RepID=A0ABY8QZV5_9MICO|nr:hypothetical protein LWF01_09175 [Brevibacteriaceae bacterium ZFBP1038]